MSFSILLPILVTLFVILFAIGGFLFPPLHLLKAIIGKVLRINLDFLLILVTLIIWILYFLFQGLSNLVKDENILLILTSIVVVFFIIYILRRKS